MQISRMSNDILSKCRTCLKDSTRYYQLTDYVDENYKILEMINYVVPQLDIKLNSQFSSLICQNCFEKLVAGYKFQQMCIETNNRLYDLLGIVEISVDPLTGESSIIVKEEIKDDIFFEREVNLDEIEETVCSDNDNNWRPDSSSDTDFSIKKNILISKRKYVKKAPLKALKIEKSTNKTYRKRQVPNPLSKKRVYTCKFCDSSFTAEKTFKDHVLTHEIRTDDDYYDNNESKKIPQIKALNESDEKVEVLPFRCASCPKSFAKKTSLTAHYNFHRRQAKNGIEVKVLHVTDADNTNGVAADIKDEINEGPLGEEKIDEKSQNLDDSDENKGYKCPDCPKSFEKQASLSAHRQVHTRNASEANYACKACPRKFMLIKSLTDHVASKHPEIELHKCDKCGKIFVLHSHLVKHLNRHKDGQKLECLICEKKFGNTSALKKHVRSHTGERPYLCPHCGKTFICVGTYRQHIERHNGLKKYHCPDCPSRFNSSSDLNTHKSTHTDAKPHVCDICNSRFTRAWSLHKHKMIHSGEVKPRNFKCDECNMTFTSIYHLRRHMRTHTGEKPYKCKFCERAYVQSGDLTKHLRTHLGENTYMCDQCPKAFKYQHDLKRHQSEHYKMSQKLLQEAQIILEVEQQPEEIKQIEQEEEQQELPPIQDPNRQIIKTDLTTGKCWSIVIPSYQQILIEHVQQLPTVDE